MVFGNYEWQKTTLNEFFNCSIIIAGLSVDTKSDRLYFINNKQIIWIDIKGPSVSPERNLVKHTSLEGDPEAITVHSNTIYVSIGGKIVEIHGDGNNSIGTLRESTHNVHALILYDAQTRKPG